eukprot:scaffold4907_cov122-Isochrysis_galbana.AAC.6
MGGARADRAPSVLQPLMCLALTRTASDDGDLRHRARCDRVGSTGEAQGTQRAAHVRVCCAVVL